MHQPLRYWPGPPPFAAYGNGWTGGGGSFSGGGASGSFGASSGLAPFNNEQVTTLATGLICIGSADGRLIPLVPMDGLSPASTGDASAFARHGLHSQQRQSRACERAK